MCAARWVPPGPHEVRQTCNAVVPACCQLLSVAVNAAAAEQGDIFHNTEFHIASIPCCIVETELSPSVQPSLLFVEIFNQNSATFHVRTEAGRSTVLHLFFRDIFSRKEFRHGLRVFPEMEFEVKSISESEPLNFREFKSCCDYFVGHQ